MKYKKAKLITLTVLLLSVSILTGIAVHNKQSKLSPPIAHVLTQTPSAKSTIAPSPTFPLPSAAMLENLFGNSSCSWPCWQGITPGITTSTKALQKLNDSPLILKNYSIQPDGSITGLGKANWRWNIDDKRPEEYGDMEWRDGIVRSISLGTSYTITIGDAINRFGPPEKIDVSNCTEVVEGPQWWCAILFYAKNGFEIHSAWSTNGKDVQITPSTPTDYVVMFEPTTIEDWLLFNGLDIQTFNLQDWKGYGNFLDLYVR